MDVDPFSLTLLEEKVYAYFVVRKMAVRKKKVLKAFSNSTHLIYGTIVNTSMFV